MAHAGETLYQRLTKEKVSLEQTKDVKYARLLMLMIKRVFEQDPHNEISKNNYLGLHFTLANKLSEAYEKGLITPRDKHFARAYQFYGQRIARELNPKKPIPKIYKPWTSKHVYFSVYCFATLYALLHRINLFASSIRKHELTFITKHMPYAAFAVFALEFIFDIGIALRQGRISVSQVACSRAPCEDCDRQAFFQGFVRTLKKDDRLHRLGYFFLLGLNSCLQLFITGNVANLHALNLFILSGLDLLHLAWPDFKTYQTCQALCSDMREGPGDEKEVDFDRQAQNQTSGFIQQQLKKEMTRLKRSIARYAITSSCVAIGIIMIAASPDHSPAQITGGAMTLFMGLYATKKRFRSAQKQTRRLAGAEIEFRSVEADDSYIALPA